MVGVCKWECIWPLSGVVPQDWRFVVIVPLYNGKGKKRRLNVRTIEVLPC